jgi:hypothetical protein
MARQSRSCILPDSPEVDAITSASTMSETDSVARTISDKVRVIINSQKNI